MMADAHDPNSSMTGSETRRSEALGTRLSGQRHWMLSHGDFVKDLQKSINSNDLINFAFNF